MPETVPPGPWSGLTAEQAQAIFPVARSDRRKNAELFTDIIPPERLKDDAAFYEGLLQIIAAGEFDRLREYDRRMMQAGSPRKAFFIRALRWLAGETGLDPAEDDFHQLPADHFPPGTLRHEVHCLYLGLLGGDAAASPDDTPEAPGPEGWASRARDLAEAAQRLDRPDVAAADELVALAEALAEACREAAAAEAEQSALEARRAALHDRLRALLPDADWRWPAGSTPGALDRMERALERSETVAQAEVEAAHVLASADRALRAAVDAADYAQGAELWARAQKAQAQAEAARAEKDMALADLVAAMRAEEGAAPPAELPPVALSAAPEAQAPQDDASAAATAAAVHPSPEALVADAEEAEGAPPPAEPAAAALPAAPARQEAPEDGAPSSVAEAAVDPSPPVPGATGQDTEVASCGAVAAGEASTAAPAETPDPEPQPEPAADPPPRLREGSREAPAQEPAALLAHYLRHGEFAFAWHLARLHPTPLPAPLLRSLAILPETRQAEDMADPQRAQALAELADALPEAADPVAAARLALAALLRPALFDPDHGARAQVRRLLGQPGLEAQASLIEALAGLNHEVRLSARRLVDLAGGEPPPGTPLARQRLSEWLEEARHRKTGHQPTYRIFHHELHREGELGRVLEAALAERADADQLADDLIARLAGNRGAQEAFVADAERRSGRPRRDRIEGSALDWFCRGLEEACEHLSAWRTARRQDAERPQQDSRQRLLSALGPVRKALEGAEAAVWEGDGSLAAAAGRVLAAQIGALQLLIEGQGDTGGTPRLRDLLEAPLLRLPGGCQDWAEEDGAAFEDERAARDRRLAGALMRPEAIAPDAGAAFEARLAEAALVSAARLLERMHKAGVDADTLPARRQGLQEALAHSRAQARERVARLRLSLTTIGYLDLEAEATLPGDLTRLSAIDAALVADPDSDTAALPAMSGIRRADVPPDFPELDALLSGMEVRRDALRARISRQQRAELEALREGPQGESAGTLLAVFDSLDPVTVDDAIAELKAGRAVPPPAPDAEDAFARFYPGFVRDLAAAPEETARGRVQQALNGRGTVGPLDLGGLDDSRARLLGQLLESWGGCDRALRRNNAAQLRDGLTRLFGLIGFTGVRLTDGREADAGRLRLLTMSCDVPRRADGFLPPAFGSASGGRYRLLVARADVPIDQLFRQIGGEDPDAAWIVVLFARLDVRDRQRLAKQTRSALRAALVLDETLLLYSGLEGDDPFATFLDCAMPFAWVQPYTTSAGRIPPEIFFGREAEIARIVARDGGGCLVYGGRQLGKSVLLNHVRGERHRPERGELALYRDIRSLGGPGVPAGDIWQELAHDLRQLRGFEKVSDVPLEMVSAIEAWLDGDPARRLLAMFDEADNFLRAEHAAGYPNLLTLKALMESSGRRFKAVFAGLHNVRRMARAPNSPLPHLGAPICVGPMNQTEANRAALRRLAVEPMRTAGLDYAEPGLAADMLARMNHYPSLVQVFGRQIVESFNRLPPVGADGPRWRLDRESLFEGATAEQIAEEIRERFQLTLNLDVRYDCIARSIALHRLESAGGDAQVLAEGLTVSDIRDRALAFWPSALARPTMADFEELLEELVDLGVLGRGEGGRYRLRSAQVAQMLGGREALEDALLRLHEREDEPAYDAALFFRPLGPKMPDARAPLSDRDLQRLFDHEAPGLRIVRAAPAVAGGDVAARLLAAATEWLEGGASHQASKGDDASLRRALGRIKAGPAALVIDGGWSAGTAEQLARHPRVARGEVLPIWCVPAATPASGAAAAVFDAGAWPEAMLRHWLAAEGLAPGLDDAETRRALMAATGGVPARLAALRAKLSELVPRPVAERAEVLDDWARETQLAAEAMGLDADDLACLRTLRDLDDPELSLTDLAELCPEATGARLQRLAALGTLRPGPMSGDAPGLSPLGLLVLA